CRNELLLHLKTYNIYYEGQNLQLRHREEDGEFIVEGLLNISWGLRRPIRLQMQDDNQRIPRPRAPATDALGRNSPPSPNIQQPEEGDASGPAAAEELPQLMRTRSDVGVRRRGSGRTAGEQRRLKRHRFSINGHFYNHKQKLRATDYPLIARVLQGPCEQVARVFLMEKDQVEEVTYDVSLPGKIGEFPQNPAAPQEGKRSPRRFFLFFLEPAGTWGVFVPLA
uniref:Ras association domain family member 2 n=1 Tax=Dromaius novaehollandiae TaxID=8790 RepID=A0A8C4JQG3_DRONO